MTDTSYKGEPNPAVRPHTHVWRYLRDVAGTKDGPKLKHAQYDEHYFVRTITHYDVYYCQLCLEQREVVTRTKTVPIFVTEPPPYTPPWHERLANWWWNITHFREKPINHKA